MKHKSEVNRSVKNYLSLVLGLMLFLSLVGCGKYISSYRAVGFVHSSEASSAFMNFYSFEGTMVFKLKSSGKNELKYTAKLESGNASVYYDCKGSKTELFSLQGGNEFSSNGGYFDAGTVYIIVETDGECINGEIRFSFE